MHDDYTDYKFMHKIRTDEEMTWKTLSSEKIFDRPWLTVRKDKVQLPNGHVNNEYYTLHYPEREWIEKHSIISVDDKQLIQSYLDTYVAELEDFQKGQLEPKF